MWEISDLMRASLGEKGFAINNELSVKIAVLHLQQRLDRFCPNMLGSPEYILGA
jgi:hypothetical protein